MIGSLRRMANEIRAESGIDEILEVEGIRSEIDNFKRLASGQVSLDDPSPNVVPDREREYPRTGPDAYEAYSEDMLPYVEPAAELPLCRRAKRCTGLGCRRCFRSPARRARRSARARWAPPCPSAAHPFRAGAPFGPATRGCAPKFAPSPRVASCFDERRRDQKLTLYDPSAL